MERLCAVVIGSNSTRSLTADADAALNHPVRGRVETRLFLGMENGRLGREAVARACEGARALCEKARGQGARVVALCATSAMRDALNASQACKNVAQAAGLPVRVLSGQEEAAYSFYGAAGEEDCGVIDIGGGSSEVVLGDHGCVRAAVSLQMGASRLFQAQPINSRVQMEQALKIARARADALPESIAQSGGGHAFYLAGGTGTCCASFLQGGGEAEGYVITRDALHGALCRLADTPPDRRALLPGFPASRADILPTGMAVLLALMDALGLADVRVTERGNTDGLLRAFVHKKFA